MHYCSDISAKGSRAAAVVLGVLQQHQDEPTRSRRRRLGRDGGDGAVRLLQRAGGLHGGLHPAGPGGALREVGVRDLRGGRRRAAAAGAGRRRGGGAAVAHGGVQGLQRDHQAEPEALARRIHEGHRAEELQPAGVVVGGVPRRGPWRLQDDGEDTQLPAPLLCVMICCLIFTRIKSLIMLATRLLSCP